MGERVGYTRVSTLAQNLDRQLDGVPVDRVFTDKASGKDTARPALADGSRVGLAIAAAPSDGTFQIGTTELSTVTSWFLTTVRAGGAQNC